MSNSENRREDTWDRLRENQEKRRIERESSRMARLKAENEMMSGILLVATRLLAVWVKTNLNNPFNQDNGRFLALLIYGVSFRTSSTTTSSLNLSTSGISGKKGRSQIKTLFLASFISFSQVS